MKLLRALLIAAVFVVITVAESPAAFHLMQIEQIIGGVNSDANAQAIQLRLRSGGQSLVSNARLRAWDFEGANPVLLLNIAADVANGAQGARVLLTTAAFTAGMQTGSPGFAPDFTLANAIPQSYLAAGRVTFEDDFGTIYWSLAWGGASYTGSHAGAFDNDADGNFGPAFESPLPISTRQGVIFNGLASAPSTNNEANYDLSANPATVTRNNGASFTVVPEPSAGTLMAAALACAGLARRWRGPPSDDRK